MASHGSSLRKPTVVSRNQTPLLLLSNHTRDHFLLTKTEEKNRKSYTRANDRQGQQVHGALTQTHATSVTGAGTSHACTLGARIEICVTVYSTAAPLRRAPSRNFKNTRKSQPTFQTQHKWPTAAPRPSLRFPRGNCNNLPAVPTRKFQYRSP